MTTAEDPELLCYCVGWRRDRFEAHVRADPAADFARACETSGVGMVCTSCLLNAEVVYARAKRMAPAAISGAARAAAAESWHIPSRGEIAAWLVRHSPLVPGKFESVCPAIAGPDLTTILTVSNAAPPPVGARTARFAVEVELRGADGRVAAALSGEAAPGQTWRADLGAALGAAPDGDVACGSARIVLRALDRGYKGMVRPHFSIRARRGSAAVHTANASRNASTPHVFSARRAGERHFVHVRNCGPREISCRANVRPIDAGAPAEIRRVLPAWGSAMIELAPEGNGLHEVHVVCDGLQRTYFVTADADLGRVSVDHV
jgi:bacterioferritin-associated ferredoxin